jgi:hypothetical protein
MGAIRGILLVLVAVVLFLSLFVLNLLWALSLSVNYDNIQREPVLIFRDFLNETNISLEIQITSPKIQSYCENNSDYVFVVGGYTLDIPCSVALQGGEAILEEGIKDVIHQVYYTHYECDFLDCMQNSTVPLFLVSEKANQFWYGKFYLFLIISLVLSGVIFLLAEKKSNVPIIVGSLLIVSSLPFMKLDSLLGLFSEMAFFRVLNLFFSQSFFVAIRILILGIIFVVIGIILKIFKIGFSISGFISKFKGREKKEGTLIKDNKASKKPQRSKSK